ncbi:MAG: CarD family transcriptional regulator, partial [Myxococcaceae bacterium]
MADVQFPGAGTPLIPPQGEGDGASIARLLRELTAGAKVRTQNLKGAARGYVLSKLIRATKAPVVCVTADEDEADQLACDLAFFLGGKGTLTEPRVLRLPAEEVLPWDELSADAVAVTERLGALFHLRRGTTASALVLSQRALHRRVMPPTSMAELSEIVKVGQEYDRDVLARKLSDMGYQSSPLVEDVGTFSVRGGLLDVYSPLYDRPVRLEFFGDTIESMRAFDPETQRTVDSLTELQLSPAKELIFNEKTRTAAESGIRELADKMNLPTTKLRERLEQIREGIHAFGLDPLLPTFYAGGLATVLDYLQFWSKEPIVYLDDPLSLDRNSAELWDEIKAAHDEAVSRGDMTLPPEAHFVPMTDIDARISKLRVVEGGGLSLSQTEAAPIHFNFATTKDLREAIRTHHGEEGALTPLVERLERWREMAVGAAIACGTLGQADRIKRLLADRNVHVKVHHEPLEDPSELFDPAVYAHLFTQEISNGFIDAPGGFAVLSDEEIFGARARRKVRARGASNPFAKAFGDLKEGDLVVHTDFGIARYAGLTTMQVQNVPGDFLVLEYAGKDKVYLPVSRMRLIQKFTGGDPSKVALDKLGGQSWEKTKKRVKEQLLKMAAELLRLYAVRAAHPGFQFSPPDRYFRQFEADFEFEETPDQLTAIEAVIGDMQKAIPMDRLVCGDVGYGKTEVAMRAAFKATLDRKQVAVLVPTTVLAQQHFLSFRKRFKDYPVTIEAISRMRSAEENRDVLKRAKEGRVD